MNKIAGTFVLSLSLFSSLAFSSVKITEGMASKNYSFSVEGIQTAKKMIEGETFQTASLVGVNGYTGIKNEVGSPEVPVIRFFTFADKKSDITISVEAVKSLRTFSLAHELKPVLESVAKIPGETYQLVKSKSYNSSAYPAAAYDVEEAGSIRGQKQFMVTLYPVQYNGGKNSLQLTRNFNVEVKALNKAHLSAKEGIVFIVGAKFKTSPSLAQYMELKKSQGFNVYVLHMAAKASADETRKQIKALYKAQNDLQFAVVIGEAEDVPGRSSSLISGLTDHYFSAIDTDKYETDINGPDIAVGRISVTNEEQLATVLKKYTRYIRGDFTSTSWLNSMSFLATDDRWELAEGTHNYVINTHTDKLGYKGTFPAVDQKGGDKLYAITHRAGNAEVMTNISKGRSIVNYSGHGANTYWDAPRVSQSDVRSLKSTSSSLPFVISNSCITGDYRVDESFAETWQRQEWGAIVFWGSMDNTYWDEDDILEKRMYDGIFTMSKLNFGDITQHALSEHWKAYGGAGRAAYYWETYHLFGDPSIELRLR